MPFDVELHLSALIPLHTLPKAHPQLSKHFTHIEAGYMML
jgi:hypothetical protein